MSRVKGLIIFLGLTQLSQVTHARDIEGFTDSQSIPPITKAEAKPQGSPAHPPGLAAPFRPNSLPRKAPMAVPAREPGPSPSPS
jgi:hypothetical protein